MSLRSMIFVAIRDRKFTFSPLTAPKILNFQFSIFNFNGVQPLRKLFRIKAILNLVVTHTGTP